MILPGNYVTGMRLFLGPFGDRKIPCRPWGEGGGALGYFLGGYVRPGLQIGTPLKETDLGVVQAFFDP